jgi:raffinose/stachyose/melibiose transport system substrate-binding protein
MERIEMKSRTNKWFSLIVVITLFSMIMASCAPAATPTAAAPAPTQAMEATQPPAATAVPEATKAPEPTKAAESTAPKISFWIDTGGDATTSQCIIDKVIAPFNAKTTAFQVEPQPQANAWDAIRTAVAGGGGPDIVYTPGPSFVYEMAKAGQLLPLDDAAVKYGWDKQFLPWALSLGKVDGKLYSIPHEIETLVLYYNKTVFDANGWKPPTTIDEYLALNDKIKAAGLIPNAAGNSDWKPADEHYWSIFVNAIAGPQKVYDALTGKTPWTDPEITKAVDTMDQLFMKGDFMESLDRYYTTASTEFLTALGDGKAVMAPSGTWWMGSISKYFGDAAGNKNDWDWVPFPTTDGKPLFALGIGSTYSINAATKYPDESAQFLTYYFSPEAQAISIAECGVAPAPIPLSADQLKGIDPRRARLIDELGKAAGAGQYGYTTWTFWPPKSDAYIYDEIEKVWAGQTTLNDYMAGLDKQFQEELKAGNIPPIPTR